jgi:hypothetical protein
MKMFLNNNSLKILTNIIASPESTKCNKSNNNYQLSNIKNRILMKLSEKKDNLSMKIIKIIHFNKLSIIE